MSRVTVTKDSVAEVVASIFGLVRKQVLIGVPQSNASRGEGNINNAALAYIHEFGSPAQNIPARPFLRPGVKKATPEAIPQLEKAVLASLDGEKAKVQRALDNAGMIGLAGARREISSGDFAALAPSTVKQRRRSRGTASMRKSESQYLDLIDSGVTPEAAQAATGIRALVNTGALRNSLTYVIRDTK